MSEGSSTNPFGQDSPPPGPPSYNAPPPGYGGPPPPPAPPPGGYGAPPSGYGAPGAYGAPAGYNSGAPTSDDRTWAMLSHAGTLVVGFVAPLVVMLTKGKESAFVREQAVESLNFAITVAIAYVVSFILFFVVIGIFTLIAAIVCHFVFSIMASMASYRGEHYRYPVNIRLVK